MYVAVVTFRAHASFFFFFCRISINRLIVKLVGIDEISSRGSRARQTGQEGVTDIFKFDFMLASKQLLQNVCRHGMMVFGSSYRFWQIALSIAHVISSSICCSSSPACSTESRFLSASQPASVAMLTTGCCSKIKIKVILRRK